MADFPSAIYSPRAIENRPGVVYDEDDTKTFFAEDHKQVTDEIVAIENALGANLGNIGLNGWLPVATIPTLQASDNPVYTLRFGADMTAIIGLGNRIKLTQHGTTKYFIVVKVGAYTGGNTDIDVYGGTDYDMENTGTYPVTVPYFSIAKAPFGFPLNPTKWTIETNDATNQDAGAGTAGNWYNPGSLSIDIPIGLWNVEYQANPYIRSTSTGLIIQTTLSTSNNSVSDADMNTGFRQYDSTSNEKRPTHRAVCRKTFNLTTKDTFYLLITFSGGSTSVTAFYGLSFAPTIIRAVCAYL
jgi:3D (Asp-Asp-Asp) domain-containing protein